MSPPPGRHRGSRPQVSNQIGEIGRTTGIKPPKKLQRDSSGFENPEEFFARAERSQPDDQDSSERSQDEDDDEDDEDGLGSIQQSNKKSNRSGGESKKFVIPQRRQERPDRFLVGEDRGRKTGIYKPQGPRGSDGFENIDDFFRSPSPTRSVASTAAQSTVQRTAQSSRTEHYEEDEEEEEEDTSMMIDGDTTSLSPTTYQRTHVAASASASKSHKPSSLRKSTVPSGSQSSSRKSLNNRKSNATSSPGTATDEEPSRGGGGGGGGGTKSIRRRLSSLSGSGEEGEEMQDEPVIEELELGSDGEDDASGGEGNTTIGGVSTIQGQVESDEEEEEVSPRSNKSRKSIAGKGKGRAVESDDEQEEERTASSNSSSRKKGRKSKATSRGSPSVEGESTPQDKKGKGKGKEVVRSPSPRYQQQDQEFDLSAFGGDDQGGDYGGGFSDDDGAGMGEYGSSVGGDSPRQERFADESGIVEDQEVEEEDQEEEEEEEEEQPVASTSKSKAKGKGKEKDKGKGKGKDKKGKEPAKEKSPRRKKRVSDESNSSMETVTAKRARRATPSQERVIEEIPRDRQRVVGSVDDHGVRRSGRQRIEPLEYWRNERIIYRKRQSGVGMTAIVRVPKIEPEPLTTVGRKRAPRSKSAKPPSRTRAKSVKEEPEVDEDEGIDDMTDPDGLVWSWEGNAETTRRICFTRKMMDPKATFNNQYLFQKIYQELDYLAGGILVIPVGGQKATKPAKDNSYIFFVTQGSVSVVCHRTRVSVGRDGSFFIPRGNSYSIEATSNKDVRLFFAQGRRVIELEDGSTRPDTMESSQQVLAYNAEGERLQSVVEEEEEEEEEEEQEESQGSGSEQQEEEEEED